MGTVYYCDQEIYFITFNIDGFYGLSYFMGIIYG